MKWIQIDAVHFDKIWNGTLYKAFAGGRMLSGGTYTEYTPHSALCPRWPDLRVELPPMGGTLRHFILSEHDPRD
jgi:hypothetical protein